ncbi:hypothetical protein GALL_397220 [mine drainage metagenome]|uniref:Uncharacterized protein n=1 Tax=mine drainage metagenome TaxID=410659 RepID=A0A1J5QF02_9ZZZZ
MGDASQGKTQIRGLIRRGGDDLGTGINESTMRGDDFVGRLNQDGGGPKIARQVVAS